jgi:hypothetical protein
VEGGMTITAATCRSLAAAKSEKKARQHMRGETRIGFEVPQPVAC